MPELLIVACGVILLLLLLLFRSALSQRIRILEENRSHMDSELAMVKSRLDERDRNLTATIEAAIRRSLQPMDERMTAQESTMNEMKDMLVQLVASRSSEDAKANSQAS